MSWLLFILILFVAAFVFGVALLLALSWIGDRILELESYIIDRMLKKDDPELYSITTDWQNHDFA